MTKKAVTKEVAVKDTVNQPVVMNVTDAAIAELEEKFSKIPDCSTKDGYEFVRVGLGELVSKRTGLGEYKSELKAPHIAFNKRVDTKYNELIARFEKIEAPMKAAKVAEDKKKEIVKQEKQKKEEDRKFKINQKINEIREIAFSFTDETSEAIRKQIDEVKGIQITKDIYEEFVTAAQMAVIDVKTKLEALLENVVKREAADAERKLEDARLADERKKLAEEKVAADLETASAAEKAVKETKRLKSIADNLDHIKNLPFEYTGSASSGIALGIASLEAMVITEDEFDEFTEVAKASKKSVLDKLSTIKKQAEEMEALQKKKEALDEREKKADKEKEAAAEETRLAEEKEAQGKKDKKALKENKKLMAEKEQATLEAIGECVACAEQSPSLDIATYVLENIVSGKIPNVTFGA